MNHLRINDHISTNYQYCSRILGQSCSSHTMFFIHMPMQMPKEMISFYKNNKRTTVVCSRKDCYKPSLSESFKAVNNTLVCS